MSRIFLEEIYTAVSKDIANMPSPKETYLRRFIIPIGDQFNKWNLEDNPLDLDINWMKKEASVLISRKEEILNEIMSQQEFEDFFSPIFGKILSKEEIFQRRDTYVAAYCDLLALSSSDFLMSIFKKEAQTFKLGTIVLISKSTSDFIIIPGSCLIISASLPVVIFPKLKEMMQAKGFSGVNSPISIAQILGVLSTLSFALPPPWGVFVAAGFQLVEAIIGSLANGQTLGSLGSQLAEAVEKEFSAHDIKGYVADLVSYMNQLNRYLSVLNKTPDNIDYISSEILPFLKGQKNNIGSGTIYNGFQQIVQKKYYIPHGLNDQLSAISLQILAHLTSAIAINQRTIVVLEAQLASLSKTPSDKESLANIWLGEYLELRSLLIGNKDSDDDANSLANILTVISNEILHLRLKAISIDEGCSKNGCAAIIRDEWTGEEVDNQYNGLSSQNFDDWKKQWDDYYNKLRETATQNIQEWLDQNFSGLKIAQSFEDIIKSWDIQLKPRKQENTIAISFKEDAKNTFWQNPQKVSYLVRFINDQGFTETDATSSATSIPGKYASLNDIPVDELFLSHRKIIIRIDETGNRKIIATLKNSEINYEDD